MQTTLCKVSFFFFFFLLIIINLVATVHLKRIGGRDARFGPLLSPTVMHYS